MRGLTRKLFCSLAFLTALCMPALLSAEVVFRAELGQTRLRVGERTMLSVSIEGDINPNGGLELPNLSPYFRVEGQFGPSVSTEMSLINGRMTRRVSVQYQYQLLAAKTGSFAIPRIAYRSGGQTYFTAPVQVEILEPQSADQAVPGSSKNWAPPQDPYLKIELDKKEVYVGEQLRVGWYLYYQMDLYNLKLAANPALAEFKVMELEKVSRLSPVEKYFQAMPWNVAFLQSLALYPLAAGKATVGSVEISYQSQSSPRDFFGMPIGQAGSAVSEPVAITVKPLPEPAPPDFTGAVGHFELAALLAKNQVRRNENNQLKVEIVGDGNPDYILEPKLNMPQDFEIYPPETKLETAARAGKLFAVKKFEYVLVARKEGEFELPAISFRYFDPEAGAYKLAQSRAMRVRVEPGPSGQSFEGNISGPAALAVQEDIRYIKPDRQSLDNEGRGAAGKGWFWLAHLAGFLLLGLAFYYRAYRERLDSDQIFAARLKAFGRSKKRLKKAKKLAQEGSAQEFASELKRGLLEYFGDRFGKSPWGLVEDEMREIMGKQGIAAETAKEFLNLLSALSRAQFAGAMENRDAKEMLARGEKIIEAMEKQKG